jgi:2-(1,2-epoxy-1,2-dihydrophenyl)acetyl-CoA isomerase
MSDPVLFEQSGGVATITLNRPESGNAANLALAQGLLAAAMRVDQDPSVRCVVLTGAGRLFCAGGDLGVMKDAGDAVGAALSELAGTLHMAMSRLARMPKPLLSLINGPAAGAGVGLGLVGDVVIAARSAHFTMAYGAIGLSPDGAGSWLLPRLIGLRKAQEMIITNRRVGAEEAVEIGLITRAVDDTALADEGAKTAAQLAGAATRAISTARALLLDSYGASLEAHMEIEARGIAAAATGAEGREGVAAFMEKRKPDFAGRT